MVNTLITKLITIRNKSNVANDNTIAIDCKNNPLVSYTA